MSFELNDEPLEQAAHQAADLFVQIYRGLEERRVAPVADTKQLLPLFADTLLDDGIGLEATLREFRDRILPNSMGTAHPLYMGLVNSSPFPAGPLADLLLSSLNNNGGAAHQHPAIMALEHEVIRSFSRSVYGHEEAAGMLLPGGTFANLQALMLARAFHFPGWHDRGPQALNACPRLYVSAATHFCVDRSARVLGLGDDNIVPIPTHGRGAMDVDQLRLQLEKDRADGLAPFCVVGTLGTTGTGAIDPLADLAQLCREFKLWFHVDACYGGAALLLDEMRPRLAGVEGADSVAIDPHKWFFMPMVAGLLLTRHGELEGRVFAPSSASYIPGTGATDPYQRGIPTSRRASALVIWMSLRAHGWKAVRTAVRSNIRLTRLLEELVEGYGFEVLPQGELSVACLRSDGSDQQQRDLAAHIVKQGQAWLATVDHGGCTWLRCNIVNLHVREHHVRKMADLLREGGGRRS